jgi:hypothetical protein
MALNDQTLEDQERRTREARLLVSRPETVFEELKKCAGELGSFNRRTADDELEKSLLERSDPLIDLALARFGGNKEAVGALYAKGLLPASAPLDARYRKGLRIACLSNQSVRSNHDFTDHDPIIGTAETRRVLAEADWDEADALICNPHISDRLLEALYERGEPFSQFDEERWRYLVMMSKKNCRLVDCRDGEDPDLGHFRIQRTIFGLLERAPANGLWLHTLYELFDSLDPRLVASTDKIDHILERWAPITIPLDSKGRPWGGYWTSAPLLDEFRCMIAALYGRGYRDHKSVILGSANASDAAVRCAYYGNARLSAKEMSEGYKRDSDLFTFAALYNDSIYLNRELRTLLETEYLSGDLVHKYRRRCQQLHKRYPHFDPEPEAAWMTQNAAEDEQNALHKFNQWAARIEAKTADLNKQVKTIRELLVFGFIVMGALMVFLLRR